MHKLGAAPRCRGRLKKDTRQVCDGCTDVTAPSRSTNRHVRGLHRTLPRASCCCLHNACEVQRGKRKEREGRKREVLAITWQCVTDLILTVAVMARCSTCMACAMDLRLGSRLRVVLEAIYMLHMDGCHVRERSWDCSRRLRHFLLLKMMHATSSRFTHQPCFLAEL